MATLDGTAQVYVSQMDSAAAIHLNTPFSAWIELATDNPKDHAGPGLKTITIQLDKANDSMVSGTCERRVGLTQRHSPTRFKKGYPQRGR